MVDSSFLHIWIEFEKIREKTCKILDFLLL